MDLIDRIAEFLRDLFGDTGRTPGSAGGAGGAGRPRSTRFVDPDLDEAWQELNDYLGEGRDASSGGAGGSSAGSAGGRSERTRSGYRAGGQSGRASRQRPLEALRKDYANLEVPFGADMETVRRSYKKLVLRYHPDKHGGDAEKLRVATEIMKRINESFERIRSFHEKQS